MSYKVRIFGENNSLFYRCLEYFPQNTNLLNFVRVPFLIDNGLVTSDGTKVLTVVEYDRFVNFIPAKFRPIFEVNTITVLRYVELQRLHEHKGWYYTEI